jgi:hypothetical protein
MEQTLGPKPGGSRNEGAGERLRSIANPRRDLRTTVLSALITTTQAKLPITGQLWQGITQAQHRGARQANAPHVAAHAMLFSHQSPDQGRAKMGPQMDSRAMENGAGPT